MKPIPDRFGDVGRRLGAAENKWFEISPRGVRLRPHTHALASWRARSLPVPIPVPTHGKGYHGVLKRRRKISFDNKN